MLDQPNRPRRPTKAAAVDPIVALIDEHRALLAALYRATDDLDNASREARRARVCGSRHGGLIAWRNCSAIGGDEIETARDRFLRERVAAPEQIEREYQDAKAREKAAHLEDQAWDLRAGVAGLRKKQEEAGRALKKSERLLARSKPTTIAGTAALLKYALLDLRDDMPDGWVGPALKTVCAKLGEFAAGAR